MSRKKKILIGLIGLEAVVIAGMIAFLLYLNSDTVKIARQLALAQRYLLEEDYEQAIAAFEVVIDIDPRNAEAYLGMAEAYTAADDLTNAVKILERGTRRTESEEIQELLDKYAEELAQASVNVSSPVMETDVPDTTMDAVALDEGQQSDTSPEDLFREYLATTLIPAYGIFEADQNATIHTAEEKWFHPAGVMDATIFDFDQDGDMEMLVSYAKQASEYGYAVNMAMYEISEGKVELASSMPFMAYHEPRQNDQRNESILLSESEWCEMSLNASVVQVDGTYYIVCEKYQVYGTFADGQSQDYWSVVYQNGELQYAFSFTQTGGGSTDFEQTGYEFVDGNCIDSEIYYAEWYEVEALYDTFESAITAFFDRHGIHVRNAIDHYRKDDKGTILSMGENDITYLFEFVNELTSYDFNTSTFAFEATLTSYGELLKN